jgi:hypothetical protein
MKNSFTFKTKWMILFILGLFSTSLKTNGQDTIKVSTTWGNDTSINNNIFIDTGAVLTINPGVTVTMMGNYKIRCRNGFIHANGTQSNNVIFTCNNTSVGWGGINIINNSTSDSSVFEYCQFLYGTLPTGGYLYSINTSKTTIFDNCIFENNKIINGARKVGFFYFYFMSAILYSNKSITVTNSSFTNNKSASTMYVDSSYYYISNCTFANDSTYNYIASGSCNYDESALAINSGNGEVDNNLIYENTGIGLSIVFTNSSIINSNYIYQNQRSGFYTESSLVEWDNNIIANNDTAGVINGSLCTFINNTITYNNFGIKTILPTTSGGADVYFYNSIIHHNISPNLSGNMNLTVWNCDIPYDSLTLTSLGFTVKSFKNNINKSPLFTAIPSGWGPNYSQAADNWIPTSVSPCINAGEIDLPSDELPKYDYSGNSRVKYGFPDMGAFEVTIPTLNINSTNCHITSNTNWVADNIYVSNDVTIDDTATLTILPGTIVNFQGCYKLNVNGNIIAKGNRSTSSWFVKYNLIDPIYNFSPFGGRSGLLLPITFQLSHTDSIIFTMANPIYNIDSSKAVFWHGIRLNQGNITDSSIFKYCRFELAIDSNLWKGAALNVEYRNKVLVSNCEFRYNKSLYEASCIAAFQSGIDIGECNYYSNKGNESVLINSSDLRIANSYFYNNSVTNDLKMYFSQNSSVIDNVFRNNVTLTNSASYLTNCELYGNTYMISSYSNFYNTVCMGSVTIDRNSSPSFFNCIFPGDTITIPASYINNCYYEKYDYPNFVWNRNDTATSLYNYERNSLYPSVNRGTTSLPEAVVLPATDIIGNPRTLNGLIDIGAFENQGTKIAFIQQPIGENVCLGDSISLTISTTDTAKYQWQKDGNNIPGATSEVYKIASMSENDEGNYICVANNAYGKVYSNPAFIQALLPPVITSQSSSALVNKNTPIALDISADGSNPLSYQWQKDGNNLVSDTTTELSIESFNQGNEGAYICKVTNVCGTVYSTPAVLSLKPTICMVTVYTKDKNDIGHNLIIWQKESKVIYKSFNIYRESSVAGYYDSIGNVSYSSPGMFEDTVVNPQDQAYLYKLTAVGTDNVETDINSADVHKTIHLLVTKGEMGGIQLDWDQYIGFPYTTYYIWRSVNGTDFSMVHQMASSTRSWTDDTIVGQDDTLYYYIGVTKDGGCDPNYTLKSGGLYAQSVSNMEDNRLRSTNITEIGVKNGYNLSCYPNPYSNSTTIKYTLPTGSNVILEVYDITGREMVTVVNTNQQSGQYKYTINAGEMGLSSGIYLVRFKAGDKIMMLKILQTK